MSPLAPTKSRRSPLLQVVVSLALVVGRPGTPRDLPPGAELPVVELPRIDPVPGVALHEHPVAGAVLEALGLRLEQNGLHVTMPQGAALTDGNCLGVKVSSGELELRFGHSELSIEPDGIALEIGIEHLEVTGFKIRTKSPVSLCDWGGLFEVSGSASDIKLQIHFAPRVSFDDCRVVRLGDISARVTIGGLNLKPLPGEIDRLLKNLVEDGITNAMNVLFPDLLSNLLGSAIAVDLCQTKLILYKAYMALLGAGVELHAFPAETVAQLQPLFPSVDLEGVRFGFRWQPERNNTTDCTRIYLSSEAMVARLRFGLDLDAAEWTLLLHELQHTEQCARLGGRDDFGRRWFRDLELAALMTNLSDPIDYLWQLHDNMPMEEEASARAEEIPVVRGVVIRAGTGELLPGVRVSAHHGGSTVRAPGEPVVADVTGAGGRQAAGRGTFAFPLEAGTYDLFVGESTSRLQHVALAGLEATPGNKSISVTIELDALGLPVPGEGEISFLRGDVNSNRSVELADAFSTLGWLFLNGPEPGCVDAADSNDDGRVDVSDALAILGFLFLGGSAPPAPFPGPGVDPTSDELGCRLGG